MRFRRHKPLRAGPPVARLVIDGKPARPYEIDDVLGVRSPGWQEWFERGPERVRRAGTRFSRTTQAAADGIRAARRARTPRVLVVPPPVAYASVEAMQAADVVFHVNDDWSVTCVKDRYGDLGCPSVELAVFDPTARCPDCGYPRNMGHVCSNDQTGDAP